MAIGGEQTRKWLACTHTVLRAFQSLKAARAGVCGPCITSKITVTR